MKRGADWVILPRMMYYEEYEASDADIDALLESAELGRLISVGPDATPQVGLYPFYRDAGEIHLHLNRHDPQLADLERGVHCLFEVDEVLGTIPSYWIDPEDARMATAYHRSVAFTCSARITRDVEAIARGQGRIMQRYQPEGDYREIRGEDPLYQAGLELLAAVALGVEGRRSKFKLAQNRPPEARSAIAHKLRARGRLLDGQAAEALLSTLAPSP